MGLLGKLFGNNATDDEKDLLEATQANNTFYNKPHQKIPEPTTEYDDNGNELFVLFIEDCFTITGRGTVVTGRVNSGTLKVGDTVIIDDRIETTVTGIEAFRRVLDVAREGDNVGIMLKDVTKNDVHRGDRITKKAP